MKPNLNQLEISSGNVFGNAIRNFIHKSVTSKIIEKFEKRIAFNYGLKDRIKSFLSCCFKKKQKFKNNYKLFKKAEDSMENELDIVKIVGEMRKMKIVTSILMKRYQWLLVPFGKENVLNIELNDN